MSVLVPPACSKNHVTTACAESVARGFTFGSQPAEASARACSLSSSLACCWHDACSVPVCETLDGFQDRWAPWRGGRWRTVA